MSRLVREEVDERSGLPQRNRVLFKTLTLAKFQSMGGNRQSGLLMTQISLFHNFQKKTPVFGDDAIVAVSQPFQLTLYDFRTLIYNPTPLTPAAGRPSSSC